MPALYPQCFYTTLRSGLSFECGAEDTVFRLLVFLFFLFKNLIVDYLANAF